MAISDHKKILADVAIATYQDKLSWSPTFGVTTHNTYRAKIKVTEKKTAELDLYIGKNVETSYLMMYFYVGNLTKEYIGNIKYRDEPDSLQSLIEVINRKIRVGKIKESMSFFPVDENGLARSEKLKNVKLINQLLTDTMNGKLVWQMNYRDEDTVTFNSKKVITEHKELTFSLRCELGKREGNILRVHIRISDLKPPMQSTTSQIKSLTLVDYPSLYGLIIKLKNKFLEDNKKSIDIPIEEGKNIEEYRTRVITWLNDLMLEMRKKDPNYITKFVELFDIKYDIKHARIENEINQLMYRAYTIYAGKAPY